MEVSSISKALRKVLRLRCCGAVIVAAGTASRMGGIDKVMAPIQGQPMIRRTVEQFQNCDAIREIVIVTRTDLVDTVWQLCEDFDKVKAVAIGGNSRQESVAAGIEMMSKDVQLVAIHDGARPLITVEVIDRTVRAANTYGAAAPAVAVKDTVKVVDGGIVKNTPDRSTLRAIQTPQVFDLDLLKGALQKANEDGAQVTDDCSAVERIGFSVKIVEGDERNIKVTTPMDLTVANMLAEEVK